VKRQAERKKFKAVLAGCPKTLFSRIWRRRKPGILRDRRRYGSCSGVCFAVLQIRS